MEQRQLSPKEKAFDNVLQSLSGAAQILPDKPCIACMAVIFGSPLDCVMYVKSGC